MFFSKFVNLRNFNIGWGIAGVALGVGWVRYLVEPRRTAALFGLTRIGALRSLLTLSAGWYLVWMGVHAAAYLLQP
jgi:hypothetical protein